jgi:YggT family protein
MSGFISVGYFLFSLGLSLLIFTLWIHVALRYLKVSALHPIQQIISKLIGPLLQPLEQLPVFSTQQARQYDTPALLLIVLIELIKYSLISLFISSIHLSWFSILALSVADMIIQPCNIAFAAIILRVIMSWVNPSWQHPIADLAFLISDPLFVVIRRYVPIVSGLDFSPLIALVILKIITLFVSAYVPLGLV